MTKRIVLAITAVAIAAMVAFGVPLGAIIERQYRDEAVVKLERQATAATIEVPADFRANADPVELPPGKEGVTFGVYLPTGRRVSGTGPATADAPVRDTLKGRIGESKGGRELIVAVPVASKEQIFAVIRASQPTGPLHDRVRRAWAAMIVLGLGIAALTLLLAIGLARRLDRPIHALVEATTALGSGNFSARAKRSGIGELDLAADALNATATRIGAIVERERAFSADASHQLRTPLTAMRVHVHELAQGMGDPAAAIQAIEDDLDRLEQTIEDFLRLARDNAPVPEPIDVDALQRDIERRWHGPLADLGRPLVVHQGNAPTIRASMAAVRQIVDVLVDNALHHGAGRVTVAVREIGGGSGIDVHDEGSTVIEDPDRIFVRRSGDRPGHGIGLALARTLAEAEGGRLLLTDAGPGPTFTLLLPGSSDGSGW